MIPSSYPPFQLELETEKRAGVTVIKPSLNDCLPLSRIFDPIFRMAAQKSVHQPLSSKIYVKMVTPPLETTAVTYDVDKQNNRFSAWKWVNGAPIHLFSKPLPLGDFYHEATHCGFLHERCLTVYNPQGIGGCIEGCHNFAMHGNHLFSVQSHELNKNLSVLNIRPLTYDGRSIGSIIEGYVLTAPSASVVGFSENSIALLLDHGLYKTPLFINLKTHQLSGFPECEFSKEWQHLFDAKREVLWFYNSTSKEVFKVNADKGAFAGFLVQRNSNTILTLSDTGFPTFN